MVGAGSQTRQKSATRAIMTLASTKSSSEENFSPRFVYSAVPLAQIPMPICTAAISLQRWLLTLCHMCFNNFHGRFDNRAALIEQHVL